MGAIRLPHIRTFNVLPATACAPQTEVSPRNKPLASVKVTRARLTLGRSATAALPVTKMPKVGVALAAIVVVTVPAGVARHAPLVGSVWHSAKLTGKLAVPVLALAVI
jgi:hypothetical protein